jgi:hypothetical protein
MSTRRYRTFSLPNTLVEQIEILFDILKKENLYSGYFSLTEFVRDSVRRRIEEIRQTYLLRELDLASPDLSMQWSEQASLFIVRIVKGLQRNLEQFPEIVEVISQSEKQGMPKQLAEKAIEDLLQQGILYIPEKGRIASPGR